MRAPAFVVTVLFATALGAAADQPGLTELYERVDPAVVEIATISEVVPSTGPAHQVRTGGLGSGFLISDDGVILTAAHVVHLAEDVAVRWATGDVSPATIVSSNPSVDLAIIKAETIPPSVTPLVLADSDAVRVGEQVFIIGAPLSYAHTLTVGHVSARRTPDDLFGGIEPVELLQTDAAINEGNSGGPMFNMDGEVIGVVSHIMSNSVGSQGLGFVITSNMARSEMLDKKPFWSGMDGTRLTEAWARIFNLPQPAGILVERVTAGSASAALGLRPGTFRAEIEGRSLMIGGDVILAIQGVPVGDADFGRKVRSATKDLGDDDLFELEVLRAGQVISLTKTVGELR